MSQSAAFQSRLYDVAVREATESFTALVSRYPNERFYAFTFYTNNDLRGVYPFANTVEGLERAGFEMNSEEQWIAGEWGLKLDDPDDQLTETTRLLIEASDDFANDATAAIEKYGPYKNFRHQTFRTLSRALLTVRQSGVFHGHSLHDQIAFWVHVGDPDGDDTQLMFQFSRDHLTASDADQLRDLYGFD